jgi:hypothetical protein
VIIADPGSRRLASSTHESGDAPVAVDSGDDPVTVLAGVGSDVLLGAVPFLSLFLPGAFPLFPCAAADTATTSIAMTPVVS